jgi:hypothetical protein
MVHVPQSTTAEAPPARSRAIRRATAANLNGTGVLIAGFLAFAAPHPLEF